MALDPIAQTICPVPLTLQAQRGNSIDVRLRMIDARTGRPLSLTGFSGTASIYASPNTSIVAHSLAVDVDQSPAGGATTGVVLISVPPGESTTTWLGYGFWALTLTDGGTVTKTVVAGPWSLASVSLGPSSFVCTAPGGAGFGTVCGGAPAFSAANSGCSVLEAGYTLILLPHPAGSCACAC